jgi:hypothetical protein
MSVSIPSPIRQPWVTATDDVSRIGRVEGSEWIVSSAEDDSTTYIDFRARDCPASSRPSQFGQMVATAGSASGPRQALISALLDGALPRVSRRCRSSDPVGS